jgi:hypothetical protein
MDGSFSFYLLADPDSEDIIDEALNLFRANVLFRNFEIKGPADRVLIYLILYITECLNKLTKNPSLREAEKLLTTAALGNFAIPGDVQFPLNALYEPPANKGDAGKEQMAIGRSLVSLSRWLVDVFTHARTIDPIMT